MTKVKIDYNQKLTALDGTTFKDTAGADLTLKSATITACSLQARGDDALSPMDLFAIGEIGAIVAKDLDLTSEQKSKLKDRVGKVFTSPALVYVFHNAIEGK